ncbi:MAG: N-6 DNA methylase [Treponema sp.]|nr:N-6 DNA methylase [Treponema sp.]
MTEVKDGYIIDYISGIEVKATPEEIGAVQIFSRILVNDYNYPKNAIQTRPQWRVKIRPSDIKKEYPVDIAVFTEKEHNEDNIYIIIECKKPNRKDGRTQLEDYLRFSKAQLGVWFNGEEKLFLKKTEQKGKVVFEEIPNIPKHGERLEDVGLYKRKDLKPAHNLKSIYKTIRNYLAANAVGITRDEVFAQQIINLTFCKIYDERFTKPDETVKFRAGLSEKSNLIKQRIVKLFDLVKEKYSDVIDPGDSILLDENSLTYAVGELQIFCLMESDRDAIADAFETFVNPSLKGGQGQFFTPRNVIKLIVEIINAAHEDTIIDPACGSGGFIVEALKSIWRKIDAKGSDYSWPEKEIASEKQEASIKNIRGIDKDSFLSKVAKTYMALIGDGRSGVFCENSLEQVKNWKTKTSESIKLNSFNVVITNPPFGKKLKVDDTEILKQYNLGYIWKYDKKEKVFYKTEKLQKGQTPQILFIERCIDFLKNGGRLGIIAPESMFCNPSHRYIVQYIKKIANIRAIISFPEELFQPYTHAKTCAVIIEKSDNPAKDHEIFMAIAKWCGHDSRGLAIPYDDVSKIIEKYNVYRNEKKIEYDHYGFIINEADIRNNIYLPKYYNPEIKENILKLTKTHDLLVFGDLLKRKVLSLSTGNEVGKLEYGNGNIPFVRTSEITNWELKLDPKHGLSEELYQSLKDKQDVKENDILMVRDGTYLVGSCAIITKNETKIVYQSHIYKIRSNDYSVIHPFLLLAVLTSPIVKMQISSKRFTQDIIDTLGERIKELILPIPKDKDQIKQIIKNVEIVLKYKKEAREIIKKTVLNIAQYKSDDDIDDIEFLTMLK